MSKSKHTPGPWVMQTSCSFRRIGSQATGKDGDVLCGVVQRSDGTPDLYFENGGFTGPDARLILAAPELLDACRKALHALKGREHDQFLRDAIAKATAT